MAKPNQEQVRGLADFLQSIRWDLTFPNGVPGSPDSTVINLRCESAGVPILRGKHLEANVRGQRVRVPGAYEYSEDIELEGYETIDMAQHMVVKGWRELCWQTRTGRQQPIDQVSCPVQLTRLDGNDNPVWLYLLYGAFMEDYKPGEMNSENKIVGMGMKLVYTYFDDGPVGTNFAS